MRYILDIYREGNKWFFDDSLKGIKHEEFVDGIPDIIKFACGNALAKNVRAIIDTQRFEGADELVFDHEDMGGVVYTCNNIQGWLCPVFWQYFTLPPKSLWVSVKEI